MRQKTALSETKCPQTHIFILFFLQLIKSVFFYSYILYNAEHQGYSHAVLFFGLVFLHTEISLFFLCINFCSGHL